MSGMIIQKLRDSARGQPCTFMIPGVCCCDTETTVLCHLYPNGRSMGAKHSDVFSAFGCFECHRAIDQHELSKADETFFAFRAMALTWAIWIRMGLIKLPVDPATAKRRPKRKAHIQNGPLPGTKASGIKRKMNGTVERRSPTKGTSHV